MPLMAGRQAFLEILRAAGVQYIIGNPGTTELPLMDVLPAYPDMQYRLTLHEGVAMAMADGYALASGMLGVLNVHVAPGLGNAMGMLHDATKTAAPLLVTAGGIDDQMGLPGGTCGRHPTSPTASDQGRHHPAHGPSVPRSAHGPDDGRSQSGRLRPTTHWATHPW